MKNIILLSCTLLLLIQNVYSQNGTLTGGQTTIQVTSQSQSEIQNLLNIFSVEKILKTSTPNELVLQVCLASEDYERFLALNLPFVVIPTNTRALTMATTVDQMANWNRYPTLSVYCQMMQNFQSQYPNLCNIDTILTETPGGRPILVAHISQNVNTPNSKPQFWYASAMHGDELTSIVLMLRLIDYLLTHYNTDNEVTELLNTVDIWISPMDNPDGTFYGSANSTSVNNSRRANYNGIDLNRSFRITPDDGYNNGSTVPEVVAMQNFAAAHHFTMSANFHGGTELVNYPWDFQTTSAGGLHADNEWWIHVASNYADTCQQYNNYFTSEFSSGITQGGNWYITTGCRQDYMNYYHHCKESTIEISLEKQLPVDQLNNLWTYNKRSLLNYMKEVGYGFWGIVSDATQPSHYLESQIFINQHDNLNTQVYSHLPFGHYHRPLKAGTYSVTISADCYLPYTFNISVSDGAIIRRDVALMPIASNPQVLPTSIYSGNRATLFNTNTSDNLTTYWFNSPSSITPLSVGNVFQTPLLTENTTYYVENHGIGEYSDCVSERIPVMVSVETDAQPFVVVEACNPANALLGQNTPLTLTMKNEGALSTESPTLVTLSCSDSEIILIDSVEYYPALLPYSGTATVTDGFVVSVLNNIPRSKDVLFTVTALNGSRTWNSYFILHVVGIDCDSPADLTATPQTDGVTLNWQSVQGAQYYMVFREDLLIANHLTQITYTDNDLAQGVEHCYKVRAVNAYGASAPSNIACGFAIGNEYFVPGNGSNSITTCEGTVYDHAGASANYSSNRNGSLIIYPENEGDLMQVRGDYATESDYDFLTIYDGVGVSGNVLGRFSGLGSFPTLQSSAGPITIAFNSDNYVNEAGFALMLSCFHYCDTVITNFDVAIENGDIYQENGFFESLPGIYTQLLLTNANCDSIVILNLTVNGVHIDEYESNEDIALFPNPTQSQITISSLSMINAIHIYDIMGKEIYSLKNVNNTTCQLDLNNYKSGVYFVKVALDTSVNVTRKMIIK